MNHAQVSDSDGGATGTVRGARFQRQPSRVIHLFQIFFLWRYERQQCFSGPPIYKTELVEIFYVANG